jgi:hypothetical protein
MKNFEELLNESPSLHNNNCCIHFEDTLKSCDYNIGINECCRNSKVIMKYFNKYGSDMLKFFPKNYKGFSSKQRKEFPEFIREYFRNL